MWVTDCRLNREISLHPLVRRMHYQLGLILQQRDPWDLRLKIVEQFAKKHGRLPRQFGTLLEERVLGIWLKNVRQAQRRLRLPAARMQKLLNSSCSSLRARAVRWLDTFTPFERATRELQQFVQVNDRMPRDTKASPAGERTLMRSLQTSVGASISDSTRTRRLQLLAELGPVVAKWAKRQPTSKLRVQKTLWKQQLDKVIEFVTANHRLPLKRHDGQSAHYRWLSRQRRLLDRLPLELREALFNSHPIIASSLRHDGNNVQR